MDELREYILRKLEELGWSQTDLAEVIERPLQSISEIVNGHRSLSVEMASRLAWAFGEKPELLLSLDARRQLARLDNGSEQRVSQRGEIYRIAPIREMIRRGWIQDTGDPAELNLALKRFYGRETFEQLEQSGVRFRHSDLRGPDQLALLGWATHAKRLASKQIVREYSGARLRERLPELLSLSREARLAGQVPEFLSSCGVRFLILSHLPKSYADGACLQDDNGNPVIVLSGRYDRIDSFWFTLLHECAHAILHTGETHLDFELDRNLIGRSLTKEEAEADRFASTSLIPSSEFSKFVAHRRGRISRVAVTAFAEHLGRHPGIVVGRLQREGYLSYSQMRAELVSVKEHLKDVTFD